MAIYWAFSLVNVCVSAITFFRMKIGDSAAFADEFVAGYLTGVKELLANTVKELRLGMLPGSCAHLYVPLFGPMASAGM